MTVCKRVEYSGRVQGVGFRYTVQRLAQGYAVNGFVKNLADGRVEILIEGELAAVERFLEVVRVEMDGYVEATRVHDEALQGLTGFRIAY